MKILMYHISKLDKTLTEPKNAFDEVMDKVPALRVHMADGGDRGIRPKKGPKWP